MNTCFDLNALGINDVAYTKLAALELLLSFEKQSVPVLGGDVFLLNNDVPILTYDSWYCNRNRQETEEEYVFRSCKVAYDYISQYEAENAIFSLVH